MKMPRRRIAAALPIALVATIASVLVQPARAAAIEPALPAESVSPTPVTQQTMLPRTANDPATKSALRGDQSSGGTVLPGGGTATASPLAPSASWQVSGHTGSFQWSYPLRVPPAPGGLIPQLALSYASASVDGRTSATNNQPSWVGDGWDLSVGFIERSYVGCSSDTMGGTAPTTGDLCWRSDNAVLALPGGGGQLIHERDGLWRLQNDDGSRVERLTGVDNGDNDGESWKVTTTDGLQYFFGSRKDATSTWTVPVFGDDAREPCNVAGNFGASWCRQAWRWNLDKVVDPNGNTIRYDYAAETNRYGLNLSANGVDYVRGGVLKTASYGMQAGEPAAAWVEFVPANRCVPGSTCAPSSPQNWPDVAWESNCDSSCAGKHSPTFWSTKRLSTVKTFVASGAGPKLVDSWELTHQFPNPGDGEKAALWLQGIVHKGHVGGEIALPAVTFEGEARPNRVYVPDGYAPLRRFRISAVVSESGGVVDVAYKPVDCTATDKPAHAHENTRRCFPVWWSKDGQQGRWDYFHKHVVDAVTQNDRIGPDLEQSDQYVHYDYYDAAWHYDTSEFTEESRRTWNDFRGFARVEIKSGRSDDRYGKVTKVEERYHQGMDGDVLPNDGRRSKKVNDGVNPERTDDNALAGFPYYRATHFGDSDRIVTKAVSVPVLGAVSARREVTRANLPSFWYDARFVRTETVRTFTELAAGGWRESKVSHGYDDRGLLLRTNDLGDVARADDDRCTTQTYHRNASAWLIASPARVRTVGVDCDSTPALPQDLINDTRMRYDDNTAFDAPPSRGLVVETQTAKDHRPGEEPVYQTVQKTTYDKYGRALDLTDGLGRKSQFTFTPAAGGPVTATTTTNPLGHSVTTTLEPAWGQPRTVTDANGWQTVTAYDALGRVSRVWLPNRADGKSPTNTFAYAINKDTPSVVTTTSLGPNGMPVTSKVLYDGLLRARQSQVPAAGGGRLIVDTSYDSQGRPYRVTQPYFVDSAVDDKIWVAADTAIPGLTLTTFDELGRVSKSAFMVNGSPVQTTTTRYFGDRVEVTPPDGAPMVTSVTDGRGQVVERIQGGQSTTYAYTKAGHLASFTDPAKNTWRYGYNLLGQLTRTEDVDAGVTTMEYDAAGQLTSTTDARKVTTVYAYDDLGRRTGITEKSTGTTLAEWTYDTATKGIGLPATATRHHAGAKWVSTVGSYNSLGLPTRVTLKVPETPIAQTLGDKSYSTVFEYNPDGSLKAEVLPPVGDATWGLKEERVTHTYDDQGRPLLLYGALNGSTNDYVTQTSYTRYGEASRLQLGEVGSRVWLSSYREMGTRRLARQVVDAEVPAPMQADVNYAYDPAGNITSIKTWTPQGTDLQCFRYDGQRRLDEAWTPGGNCAADPAANTLAGPARYWNSYDYDAAGNRTVDVQHGVAGDTRREYTYLGTTHRLLSVEANGPAGTKRSGFTYDPSGNTLTRPGQNLDWTPQGRLEKVTEGDKVTSFVYGADQTRLLRDDPTGVTLYLGGQEVRLDKGTGAMKATRYYAHGGKVVASRAGGGGSGPGSPAGASNGTLSWLAADHQNTTNLTVDAADLTVTGRRFDPFGGPRGTQSPFPVEKGFVGGTVDPSTGLTNLGAREYDPSLGRFISTDPVLLPNDPQQLNGYGYANNSPVTFSDPSGLIRTNCPDGECRGGGWDKGKSPASTQGSSKNTVIIPGPGRLGGRCPDNANRCAAVGASYSTSKSSIQVKRATYGTFLNGMRLPASVSDVDALVAGMDEFAGAGFFETAWDRGFRDTLWALIGACESSEYQFACNRETYNWALEKQEHNMRAELETAEEVAGFLPGGSSGRGRRGGAACAGRSFDPDTEILMADGSVKRIRDVKPGDKVLATDPVTGRTAVRTVEAQHLNDDVHLVDLVVREPDGTLETIHTTYDHPFWVDARRAWIDGGQLKPGDELHAVDGHGIAVVEVSRHASEKVMFDLTVADIHTYYVVAGETPVLVHNCDSRKAPFDNFFGSNLDAELSLADELGVRPVGPGQAGFDEAINSGTVKWAIGEDGSIRVMPKHVSGQEISHSVLFRGAKVLAAGEAEIGGGGGQYYGLSISNHSGHYTPCNCSLDSAVGAFGKAGIPFAPGSVTYARR